MEAENVVEPVVEEQPKGPQVSAQPTTVVTGATVVTVDTVPELFDTGLPNYWPYCCKSFCVPCCWGCVAKEIGEWLQMGTITNFYIPLGLLLLIARVAPMFLPQYALIINYVDYAIGVTILCLVLHQRRAWVNRFGTGENVGISCLISWFCMCFNYGQMGGHKESQVNVV